MFHRDCPLDSPLTASSLAVPSLPASSLRHHSKNVGMPPLSRPGRVQWFRRVEQTTLAKSASFACIFLAGTEKSRGIRNPESKEIWTPSGSGKESKKRCSRSESWLRNLWSLWYIYFSNRSIRRVYEYFRGKVCMDKQQSKTRSSTIIGKSIWIVQREELDEKVKK